MQILVYHARELERMSNHFHNPPMLQQNFPLHTDQSNIRLASPEAVSVSVPKVDEESNELGLPRHLSDYGGTAESRLFPEAICC